MAVFPPTFSEPSPPTPPAKPAASRKKRFRKAARRLAYAGLGLLGILLVVFLLLPIWISNEQGRTYVLQQLNKGMPAKIAIEDWSLGWFRGTELKNVTITLPDGTRLLSCPRVQSELTLWGILWGRYDVGTTRIDTAQIAVTRYADGSNSLQALFHKSKPGEKLDAASARIFRTFRGSMQVGSAVVTINSLATGKSITYTDVKAALTIASPDAPFHVQISAVGGAPGTQGELALSLNATLPALAAWPPPPWAMVSDVELSATNFPSALVCDFCGIDPRWEDSIGTVIERLRFSNHVTPPLETSLPSLEIRGTGGAFIDAAMLLRAAGDARSGGATATLSLPASGTAGDGFHASAGLRASAPLAALLGRINPLLGALEPGGGLVHMQLTEFNITANNTSNVQATARLTFPPLQLHRSGFVAQLLTAAGDRQADLPAIIPATADELRLRAAGGAIAYDNFAVTCGRRQKLLFSGTASLDGSLNLLASAPTSAAVPETLGSSSADIPITGTAEHPLITLPK